MITTAREEGVVTGREIADRRRGSCRIGVKLGESFVEVFAREPGSVRVFFSIQNQNRRDNFEFVSFNEIVGEVAG